MLSLEKDIEDKLLNLDNTIRVKELIETIKYLSKSKTGALMTFEKNDDITSISKNGVGVDAPVSKELLCTIFYPGTRLHDGAVVIRSRLYSLSSLS